MSNSIENCTTFIESAILILFGKGFRSQRIILTKWQKKHNIDNIKEAVSVTLHYILINLCMTRFFLFFERIKEILL